LSATAGRVANTIGKIPGVVDVQNGIVLAGDAIDITVDRDKAALEGVDPDQVTQQLTAWFKGIVTTRIPQDVKLVDVRVWVPADARDRVKAFQQMELRAPDGHRFPLRRIAQLSIVTGQAQITRDDLKRMVAVTGRISGRDLGSTIQDVKAALAQPDLLPGDIYYRLGGLYQQQQIAFRGLIVVFVAALSLVFLLLLFLYEDFIAAITILISPLLALAAVFSGLWWTGIELNITAMMGMTMIVGIVTEVSIFLFSEYRDLLGSGMPRREALVQAGVNRMRPIAMTTLAAILALLPLALAFGQGAQMQQPLAVAIIAGLLVQMPLVLMLTPVLYSLLARRSDPHRLDKA
jgi:multidrug efflux pump subunit AcrB